jgi:hypothetical protein
MHLGRKRVRYASIRAVIDSTGIRIDGRPFRTGQHSIRMAPSPAKSTPSTGVSPMASEAAGEPSELVRSIISLLVVIHFFCVFTVLSSTYLRSTLQSRLVSIFGMYTELLAFDPGQFVPYFYTHGRTRDDDAIITLELYPAGDVPVAQRPLIKTVAFPMAGSNWLDERRRAIRLAQQLAYFADPEVDRDDLAAEIARGVGGRVMREHAAQAAILRCTRRLSQPLDLTTLFREFPADNPAAPAYDELMYEADVYFDEDGQVQAIRRQAAAEVAPRRTSVPRGQGPGAAGQAPGAGEQDARADQK